VTLCWTASRPSWVGRRWPPQLRRGGRRRSNPDGSHPRRAGRCTSLPPLTATRGRRRMWRFDWTGRGRRAPSGVVRGGGSTWSVRWAATSHMRRALQEGQMPRPLHENGISRSWPQSSQRAGTTRSVVAKPRNPRRTAGRPVSISYITSRDLVPSTAIDEFLAKAASSSNGPRCSLRLPSKH
jgi:hypothetical protein